MLAPPVSFKIEFYPGTLPLGGCFDGEEMNIEYPTRNVEI